MNPSVTPTRQEIEGWLPGPISLDVAGIVHDYLGNPFVTLWEVRKGGIIWLPIAGFGDDYWVSWGDGTSNHIQYNDDFPMTPSHTYSAAGQYRVHITMADIVEVVVAVVVAVVVVVVVVVVV